MIGLERFPAGTATRAVLDHLADVRSHVDSDLTRAPEHQLVLTRSIDVWARWAADHRRNLDAVPAALAGAQFARPLPPTGELALPRALVVRLVTDLRRHQWLIPVPGLGGLYRCAVGAPFGVIDRPPA